MPTAYTAQVQAPSASLSTLTRSPMGGSSRLTTNPILTLPLGPSAHFETAWRDLGVASQPTLEERNQLIQEHISHQRKRLFDGAILTDKLLPVLSFGNEWISSIVKITEAISRLAYGARDRGSHMDLP